MPQRQRRARLQSPGPCAPFLHPFAVHGLRGRRLQGWERRWFRVQRVLEPFDERHIDDVTMWATARYRTL